MAIFVYMSNILWKGTIMKRFFTIGLIAAMTFVIVMPASAQLFGISVKGGLNLSTLRGDFEFVEDGIEVDPGFSTKTGFVAGVAFNTGLIPLLSLQTEILYSEKGAKLDMPFDDIDDFASIDASIDLTYLEVPVLLRAGLPIPGFSPFLYAGPAFAYNLSAEITSDIEFTDNGQQFSVSGSEDIKDEIKSFDVGFIVGAGLEFGLPMLKLHAEVRYTMGLSNISDVDNNNDTIDIKNGVVSLMVGVTF